MPDSSHLSRSLPAVGDHPDTTFRLLPKVVAKALLKDLVERGVNPERRRLFVIDGSKALRRAIDAVFGSSNLVQRCRKHKERNVLGYLPDELKPQVQSTLRAAWHLSPEKGKARLEKLAKWFEDEYPFAAESGGKVSTRCSPSTSSRFPRV